MPWTSPPGAGGPATWAGRAALRLARLRYACAGATEAWSIPYRLSASAKKPLAFISSTNRRSSATASVLRALGRLIACWMTTSYAFIPSLRIHKKRQAAQRNNANRAWAAWDERGHESADCLIRYATRSLPP